MDRESAYQELFDGILSYDEVLKQKIIDNGEELVEFKVDFLPARREFEPLVRETVAELLEAAEKSLPDGMKLQVVNSYRPLEIQKKLFAEQMEKYAEKIPDLLERKRFVHKFAVAAPECAGHPTGGAVDVQIIRDGKPLDFGTKIWNFSNDTMVFSPFISAEAAENRKLLREVMTGAGFAPFNGEWWHFSYGDQEWAAYYGKPNAIYGQI